MKVHNKVLVVTGGGSGMGRELVLALLSKGASVAAVLLGTNVRVTVVFPGAMGTNIAVNSGVANSLKVEGAEAPVKMLEPAKAAQIIIEGIEHNRYRVLVGADARLMDAVYRLNPQRAARFIYSQMRALLPQ